MKTDIHFIAKTRDRVVFERLDFNRRVQPEMAMREHSMSNVSCEQCGNQIDEDLIWTANDEAYCIPCRRKHS